MKKIEKVLIVGGGIGGLTAAIALHRKGIASEVVEENPAWSVYGVGIIQPSNVLRALNSIGLGEACIKNGRGFQGWQLCDSQGRLLVEVGSENVAGEGYPPMNGIRRPALHQILTQTTLEQGTRVRLGLTLSSWTEDDTGVDALFSDGSVGRYDLVIAADGGYSATRAKIFSEVGRPRFTGQAVWRYNFVRPRDLDWGMIYFGSNSKAGLVPLSEDLMYLFLVTPEPGNPRQPADRLHTLLRERLAEYGGLLRDLREQIVDPTQVVYRPLEAMMVPAPWHKGRVLLIGDAAHSSTPHLAEGAGMAIEDSVVLAEILADSSDIEVALNEFVHRRLPRAQLVYEAGLQLGEWELAEWSGTAHGNTGTLMGEVYARLAEPV